jgi:hypothetical protein
MLGRKELHFSSSGIQTRMHDDILSTPCPLMDQVCDLLPGMRAN